MCRELKRRLLKSLELPMEKNSLLLESAIVKDTTAEERDAEKSEKPEE